MIEIKCISEVDYDKYDEVWAIVRSMKNKSDKMIQVTELAPTTFLFHSYLEMKKLNIWNEETFLKNYVPRFLKDLSKSQSSKDKLNELYKLDRIGRNICLVCFCTDEKLCHRSIIAGLLQGVGCNVKLPSKIDYSRYYEQYRHIVQYGY